MKSRFAALLLAGIMTLSLVACGQQAAENTASTSEPETIVEQPSIPEGVLAIAEQGMFSAGGTVITSDGTFDVSNYYTSREGSTAHVDHANVLYQIPAEETGLPMVFLHGYGQSRMGWMTTPDGREGWSDMFLKMGHTAAGGISTVVHLPDEGITGNDHFMFQDMNNDVIAEHIENWIQANVMSAE